MLQQSVEELQALGRMVGIGPERCADIKSMEGSIVDIPSLQSAFNAVGLYNEQLEHMINAGFQRGYSSIMVHYNPVNVDDQSDSNFPPVVGKLVMPQDDLSVIYLHTVDAQGHDRTTVLNTIHAGDTLQVNSESSADPIRNWTTTANAEWHDQSLNVMKLDVEPAATLNYGGSSTVFIRIRRFISGIDFFPAPQEQT